MACETISSARGVRIPDVETLLHESDEAEVTSPSSAAFPKRGLAAVLILLGVAAPAAVVFGSRTQLASNFVQKASAVPVSEQDARELYYNDGGADNQWFGGSQWNPGYGGGPGGAALPEGHVPCGPGERESCTCEWSTAAYCSVKDSPQTECWGCCCSRLFPGEYQRAIFAAGSGGGFSRPSRPVDEALFPKGSLVRVMKMRGLWEQAVIVRYVGNQQYEVRMRDTGKLQVVTEERIALDSYHSEWWCWLLWDCCILGFFCCLTCLCCAAINNEKVKKFFKDLGA